MVVGRARRITETGELLLVCLPPGPLAWQQLASAPAPALWSRRHQQSCRGCNCNRKGLCMSSSPTKRPLSWIHCFFLPSFRE